MWNVTADDVESIAIGAGILGAGGGGNPYLGEIWMKTMLAAGHSVKVHSVDEIADNALVTEVGGFGAPTVLVEKLPRGDEPKWAIEALEGYIGQSIDAILCAEIGGVNSISPLIAGALMNKPVVDGDAMGRAFPELQMSTHFINGVPAIPAALVDEKGNRIIFSNITSPKTLEKYIRDLCILMGCSAELAVSVMSGKQIKKTTVRGTITLAKRVGEAVRRARRTKESMIEAVLQITGGSELFTGKLVDVQRRTTGGFARGDLIAEGLGNFRGKWLHSAFQNEYLVAWVGDDRNTHGEPVACVPDLICMLETETGEPMTTEQLRYGLRVTVLGIPCSDMLRTPQALDVVGPAAFGYPDVTFIPMNKVPGQGLL